MSNQVIIKKEENGMEVEKEEVRRAIPQELMKFLSLRRQSV